jgi:hypothetical protein
MARMMRWRWGEKDLLWQERWKSNGEEHIRRLRSGQFGFSGHTITLSQDVNAIARDLPRTVADAGITLAQVVDAAGENEMGSLPDLEDEYIDMPDLVLEDPDEDEVVYVAAGGDNLLYTYMRGLPEEGIIYYEVNRQGSLHQHVNHLATEQFVQAQFRYEVNRRGSLHTHAHLLYMRPNTSSKATAP